MSFNIPKMSRCLIDRLPNELLEEILIDLDNTSLKLLRETSKFFAEYLLPRVCKRVIGNRIRPREDIADILLKASRSLQAAEILDYKWQIDHNTTRSVDRKDLQQKRTQETELVKALQNLHQLHLIVDCTDGSPLQPFSDDTLWSMNAVLKASVGIRQLTLGLDDLYLPPILTECVHSTPWTHLQQMHLHSFSTTVTYLVTFLHLALSTLKRLELGRVQLTPRRRLSGWYIVFEEITSFQLTAFKLYIEGDIRAQGRQNLIRHFQQVFETTIQPVVMNNIYGKKKIHCLAWENTSKEDDKNTTT